MAGRQYELVYILPPDTTEQQVAELHTQVEAVVARLHGIIEKTENWGRKRLAYEIGHHKEGVYILDVINGSGELMKELETRSGGSYRVSAGTMYPALQQLEDEGMILSETKDGKRVYQLTPLGEKELERERATADNIWRRTSDWGDWGEWIAGSPLGPLMKATIRAMKQASREPAMRKRVEEILDRARRELEDL